MAKLDGVKVVNENTVEFNGFVYELVTDGGRVDDLIQCFEEGYDDDLTYEAFYEVVRTNKINDMKFLDDINDERSRDCNDDDWKVFRKSHAITNDKLTDAEGVVKIELPDGTKLEGTPSDLEKITRSMQKMQNEQQGQAEQVATAEMPEEDENKQVAERLQVGDYAKVIGNGDKGPASPHVFDIDEVVSVVEDAPYAINGPSFICKSVKSDKVYSVATADLVKATDEEVLEAKQALLKEGDFARVIGVEHTKRCGFHDVDNRDIGGGHKFEIGTVVELKENFDGNDESEDAFEARYLDGSNWWWVHRKDLEPLTKEEVEHIEREAEEEKKAKAEKLKWAAIGREVGEIKDGDIVKVIDKSNTYLKDGDIGVVSDSYEYVKGYGDKKENSVGLRVNTSRVDNVNWLDVANVELIVPVEQRFDTVG
ncbi:hypothetical protein [Bacillus cytotoxicus]|uniref:hypothetical protein n=1 Tax=Bacillus cytotoxicus TaxID=580165 RepID=UPI0024496BE9|nr:hypothetical protein [Bacillus cytotoxicus]MDH2882279.1 hypothetical protein [Bacillus cytotoxicus]HDR7313576.1 hypothetical protein [Bacillus cytotoxicus]